MRRLSKNDRTVDVKLISNSHLKKLKKKVVKEKEKTPTKKARMDIVKIDRSPSLKGLINNNSASSYKGSHNMHNTLGKFSNKQSDSATQNYS